MIIEIEIIMRNGNWEKTDYNIKRKPITNVVLILDKLSLERFEYTCILK